MRRALFFLAIRVGAGVCLVSCSLHAQTATGTNINDFLADSIRNCQRQVATWRLEEHLALVFAIALIVFGVIISVLHGSDKKWVRVTILALGACSSILTAIDSRVLKADDRTLARAVSEGDGAIRQMDLLAQIMEDGHASPKDWQDARDSFLKELTQFQVISDRLAGVEQAENREALLPVVYAQSNTQSYAQSKLPAWVQKPPQDSASLYFVGSAADPNLTSAKQNSLDDAYHNGVLALRSRAPKAADPALLALVKGSGVVRDTAVAYDTRARNYVAYTLLLLSAQIEKIGIASLPSGSNAQSPQTRFQQQGWQPADLTSDAQSGMFALDSSGGVSRLVPDREATSRIERLFRIDTSDTGVAVAASADSVYAAANSQLGCKVYKYSLMSKTVSKRLLVMRNGCGGIAANGSIFYVTVPGEKEIRYWDSWDAGSAKTWSSAGIGPLGYVVADAIGGRLIAAEISGKAYAVSLPEGKAQLLTSNLGAVTSITSSRFETIAASGKDVLFISRFENRGETPPAGLRSLTGGHIVGVAVDGLDQLWFADYDKKLVEGPFPLS